MASSISTLARNALGLTLVSSATLAAALSGAATNPFASRQTRRWYNRLNKPPFQPPPDAFGKVWSALYLSLAYSAYRALRAQPSPERSRALRWWGVQIGLNGLWSPLFFGLRRPRAALADSLLLLAASGNYARHAKQVDRPAALLTLPYLAWLGFATLLNAEIVRRNA